MSGPVGLWIFSGAILVALGGFALFIWGYDRGVRDTEKRWADTVAKAEWEKGYNA